jgi:hypothetical protein
MMQMLGSFAEFSAPDDYHLQLAQHLPRLLAFHALAESASESVVSTDFRINFNDATLRRRIIYNGNGYYRKMVALL